MMNRTAAGTLLSLTLLLFSACSNDDEKRFTPTLPTNGGSVVKAVTHSGNQSDSYNWTFNYSDGRLVYAAGQLVSTNATRSFTATISYHANTISVKRSDGNSMQVTLNNDLLVSNIKMNSLRYDYTYAEGRLVHWECKYIEPVLGTVLKRSYADISYADNDIRCIDYVADDANADNRIVLTFTPSETVNRNGLLPAGVSEQLGMSGMEFLYYAGLLGRSNYHLVGSVTYQYTKMPDNSKTVTYSYADNGKDGNIVSCTFDKANSVQYRY